MKRKPMSQQKRKKSQQVVVIPTKRRAYMAVVENDGYRLGIAVENEPGYHLVRDDADLGGTYESHEKALQVADAANASLGLEAMDAALIVASTIRAQHVRDKGSNRKP